MLHLEQIRKFRNGLRAFERGLAYLNSSKCCEVSLAQCHTILEIGEREKITVTDLAKALNLDKSTISRTIDNLVKQGYIQRVTPQENRRITYIKLSEEGNNLYNKINRDNDTFFGNILTSMSNEEIDDFIESFTILSTKMINAIDKIKKTKAYNCLF